MKFLHLADNEGYIPRGQEGHDNLYKLRPFLEPLLHNFQQCYILHRELSVDEAMIGFKGRLVFIQYLPNKPTKWGMKAYVLADSSNGYVWNWKLYTGIICVTAWKLRENAIYHSIIKNKYYIHKTIFVHNVGGNAIYHNIIKIHATYVMFFLHNVGKDGSLDLTDRNHSHAVVIALVEKLDGRGHHVYVDNYYTSPALFSELRERGFGACGTVRVNRRGMPPELKKNLEKGSICLVAIDDSMMALKWADKRQVSMLSTVHDDSTVTKTRRTRLAPGGREEVRKPTMIEEYNKHMGGVDKSDQLLSYYGFPHRTVKWWRRAFFHLIDLAVVNAYIMYTEAPHRGRQLTHEQFRIKLASQMLSSVAVNVSDNAPTASGPAPHPLPPLARLTERHFPGRLPRQTNCIVCSRKRGRKTTTFCCKQCNLPMCATPCFELYHTKVDPQRCL